MTKAGSRLLAAAHEALAIARGEADPVSYVVHNTKSVDVRRIRKSLGLSQEKFAERYRLGLARLRDWEQGRSAPDSAARAYLRVIEKEHEAVDRALQDVA
jgi:putative transcriptional regulator